MKYSEARPLIKTGDVLAWGHKGWGSFYDVQLQLVKMFTRSNYTHVGIAFCIGERVMILESVSAGIRMFPLSKDLPFYWLPMPQEYWTDDLTTLAMSKFGEKYSKWEGVQSVFKRIKPGANSSWECAEFVQWILQNANHNINTKNLPSKVVEWCQETLDIPVYLVKAD